MLQFQISLLFAALSLVLTSILVLLGTCNISATLYKLSFYLRVRMEADNDQEGGIYQNLKEKLQATASQVHTEILHQSPLSLIQTGKLLGCRSHMDHSLLNNMQAGLAF